MATLFMADPRKPLQEWLASKWLARAAQALCILAIAYMAANSTHYFYTGSPVGNGPHPPTTPSGAAAPAETSAPSAGTNRPSDVSIEQLRSMHLFGRAPAPAERVPTENLQETKLSLTLVGVFVGTGATSRALIARKGHPAESYAVGDRLPGNAKLVAVHQNRVVITRDGVRELIRFAELAVFRPMASALDKLGDPPRKASNAASLLAARRQQIQPNRGSAWRGNDAPTDKELAARHWSAIERDPATLLRELGVGTDEGGGPGKGYGLGTLANRPELNHTGLQPGDRLLSVNGHPVGDPEADRGRLAELAAQGSLRLEIQRGERRMFITVAL